MASKKNLVSVTATYWIIGDIHQKRSECFDRSNVQKSRIGLQSGATPVKPMAGDYSYSGIHDQGPLPAPREGGDMALLFGCVEEAKNFNDSFLTEVIKEEKQHAAVLTEEKQLLKKMKLEK